MRPTWCSSLLVLVLLATGCGKGDSSNRDRRAPTPYELVSAWAGPKGNAVPYTQVEVPGFEIFWVTTTTPYGADNGFGVAIPIDERNFLEGKGALRALLARGAEDPLAIAHLALVFLERGGDPLSGARTDEHREYGVTPPRRESGVLTFWYERRSNEYIELLRAELDLDTLDHRTRSIHLEELQVPTPRGPGPRPLPPNHP